MSIMLHPTGYGAGATDLLVDVVRAAKASSRLSPVTIVVPSNFVGVSVRRALAGAFEGGVIGLSILTIWRLAELLGAPALAATGRRPVSTPVVGAAIRRVLQEQAGIFAQVHDHPATETSLIAAHRELSDLTDGARDSLAATSERSSEVVRVHRAARAHLADDWYDEADLMASAREVAATSTVLDDLGSIVLHLPQRLSPAAAGLLTSLAARTDVHVLAGLTGHAAADSDVRRCLARLDLDTPEFAPQTVGATRILTVSDAEEEARTAVAEIIAAARRGLPLERLAVLYPSTEPYARVVADHLDAAGIPWNGQAVRPLADRVTGRWLLDLLALARSRWTRPDVLGIFASAPLRAMSGHVDKVAAWERVSREAGIIEGRASWDERLTRFADRARAAADEIDTSDDTNRWRSERRRRDAATADDLRDVVAGLAADLDGADAETTWSGLATWAAWMLANHLGDERERSQWPALEQEAAQKVEAALDRLASLDQIEAGTGLGTFTRALELELDDDLGRNGRFGEGVMVGTLAAGLGIDIDQVIVLGMAEGVLPTRPREDSLLADADRAVVADQLPLRTSRVGTEHRRFLAAVASATERILVFPRGDLRRSVERAPSRWLREAVEEATGQRDLADADGLVTHIPSYAGRIAITAFASDDQELRLVGLQGQRLTQDAARRLDDVLGSGVMLLEGRGGQHFTRFNGNLAAVATEVAVHHDPPARLSASRVEAWLACPHGYFARHVLGVQQVENPEEQLTISPMERGNLVHDVLERWLGEQIDAGTLPDPGTPWPGDARVRLLDHAGQALDDVAAQGVVGHPVLWRQERRVLQHEFIEFLARDDDLRARRGLTPIAVEAPFGLDGAAPLEIQLSNGNTMRFGGKIDRLDRDVAGRLVVTDYKTGSSRHFKGLSQDDPDAGGGKVQLMLYALAARALLDEPDAEVHAQYWFTSTKGEWAEVGYDVTAAVEARLLHVLGTVDDGIRRGVFPQRPEAPGWQMYVSCHHCDPDGLGTAARHREFERLVPAAELASWLALAAQEVNG